MWKKPLIKILFFIFLESDSSCSCPWVSDEEDKYEAYGKDLANQLGYISDPRIMSGVKWRFEQILKEAMEITGGMQVTSVKDNSTNTPLSIIASTNISNV